ncbi:hypothetical protein BYT27DRAFT_7082201 [Phlegmacium glaucopus]|nr:hypothetical protein BYT27DRAFT_7082201 [Phlegmacium glaucopus]
MRQLVQTHCQAAALRLATVGEDHPLYKRVQKALRRYPKSHPSPLHGILHNGRIKPYAMESIDPKPKHPNWASKIQTRIAEDKEEACREEEAEEADIRIYSDGSGKDGRIGAAAALCFGFHPRKMARYHLGSSNKHMVFEGEYVRELLRLCLLHTLGTQVNLNRQTAVIGVDSQVAIQRLDQREGGPASYIVKEIHKGADDLMRKFPRLQIKVRWTPGHVGLKGNKEVDKEAKTAMEGEERNQNSFFGILKGIPAHKRICTQTVAQSQREEKME